MGMWGEGLGAGLSRRGTAGQKRPSACSRIRVSYGLRFPRPPRIMGAPSSGAPGWGKGESRERGQQCSAVRQPRLGPTSITGCLSDPGLVTVTSPGLSFHYHKMETAATLLAGLLCHSWQVTAPPGSCRCSITLQTNLPSITHLSFPPFYLWHQQGLLHTCLPPSQRPFLFHTHAKCGLNSQ